MEQPTHVSSGRIRALFATILLAMLFTATTARPAGAQTNTFLGSGALGKVTTGSNNTALGFDTLFENTTNSNNTAVGASALGANVADGNTAVGANALFANSSGHSNTATGFNALFSNEVGSGNTGTGTNALRANTTGTVNTADGGDALRTNTGGIANTATGFNALFENTLGGANTGTGVQALVSNTTGNGNTADGDDALFSNTTGNGNTALGVNAGGNLTIGNNNIEIGNVGFASDTNTIRIGTKGTQTRALVAGIYNSPIFGLPVVVNPNGRLGIQPSSVRFKRDIHDMGEASNRLMKLRPVTFRYRKDPKGTVQYGLVAEEVARVYPDLVTYGDDGKPLSVAYQMLPAMLLNELKKKDAQIVVLQKQIGALQKESGRIEALTVRLSALEQAPRRVTPERLADATR